MIKPDFFGHLTTGMFNLIVKDPRRTPPERAALDRVTRLVAVRPRTCCAVWQRVSLSIVPGNTQAALGELSETIEDSSGCQRKSSFFLLILAFSAGINPIHFFWAIITGIGFSDLRKNLSETAHSTKLSNINQR